MNDSENGSVTQDDVYTINEVAKRLKVEYITVHRLLKRRKLKACGSIRHKRIPRAELERFLREDMEAV